MEENITAVELARRSVVATLRTALSCSCTLLISLRIRFWLGFCFADIYLDSRSGEFEAHMLWALIQEI